MTADSLMCLLASTGSRRRRRRRHAVQIAMLVKVGQPEIRQALQYLAHPKPTTSNAREKKKNNYSNENEDEEEEEEEEREDLLLAIGDLSQAENDMASPDSLIILVAGNRSSSTMQKIEEELVNKKVYIHIERE